MPPPATWIKVDEAKLGQLQWMIDTNVVDVLDDPIVFAVRPGGPNNTRAEALRLAVEALAKALDAERKNLLTEAKNFREGIGIYVGKLLQADADSDRILIPFDVRSDTTVSVPDSVKA